MPHLTDGQLRARLDAERDDAGARHLAGCAACQQRLAELAERRSRVAARFAALTPSATDPALAARPALTRFRQRIDQQEKVPMLQKLFSRSLRPAWAALTVVAVLAAALSFEPVRVLAGQFLSLFRVRQVTLLPVDFSNFEDLAGNEALAERMAQAFSDSVNVVREPGEPTAAASAAEAGRLAGFAVRGLAADLAGPVYRVAGGSSFEFTVDRDQAQALLDDIGRGDLQLPASLNGATVSVKIPAGVTSAYGDCQALADPAREGRPRGRVLQDCVVLMQIPSPTVTAPPDVDVAQLAEIALQLTGMSAAEARAFSQTVDWTSTLVIPVPRNADYEPVTVDGVAGYIMGQDEPDGFYTLLWVKDGLIYSLNGYGAWAEGLALAETLK